MGHGQFRHGEVSRVKAVMVCSGVNGEACLVEAVKARRGRARSVPLGHGGHGMIS